MESKNNPVETIDMHIASPGGPVLAEAAFQRRLSTLFAVNFCVEPLYERPFKANVASFACGDLRLASLEFSAHTTSRHPVAPAHQQEVFIIGHQQQGHIVLYQDGRKAQISPGDLYVLNANREFTIETEDILTNSMVVPASVFRAAYPEVDCCTATAFPLDGGSSKPAGSMLRTLFEIAPSLTPKIAEQYYQSIPHIIAAVLATRPQLHPDDSKLALYHKERIRSFIRRNLKDRDLDCNLVAKAMRLSPRYVYDLVADEPLTLMRWIWTERVARCRLELENPRLQHRTISEIAFSWGFVDLAHFSRSFKKTYGISPRAFRNQAVRATSLPAEAASVEA